MRRRVPAEESLACAGSMAQLLASALVAGAKLWTRDRRLADAAAKLGVAAHAGS